ncbi:hypothetical protein ACTXT7_001231 [Hymenolepis weldensis]
MTLEEVNSLLVMSLERIDKLQDSLKSNGEAAKQHIAAAIRKYKIEADRITQEAVERAIHREQVKREIEHFEWVCCFLNSVLLLLDIPVAFTEVNFPYLKSQ